MKVDEHFMEEALGRISEAGALDNLAAILADLRKPFELANFVYHAIRFPGSALPNAILLTCTPEWTRRYIEQGYFRIDPVVVFGRRGFLPFDWSQVDHASPEACEFFKDAARFGVGRQGITIPVRGPGGERALFSMTSNASDEKWVEQRIGFMHRFQAMAQFVHDRAAQLSGLRLNSIDLQLSHRERQSLQGIADGLTPKQIAAKFHLSTTAINFYLKSARHKLHCASIPQAVFKAACLELLEE